MIRTLLVDDEPIVRKGLMHIMPWEKYGIRIVSDVDGGAKALELLNREPYDLLVTDLTMPGMSGFDLIQETKRKYPQLAIVILTCHQDFQYVQEALRLGALDYIVKTELDDEKLDGIFERISTTLKERGGNEKKGPASAAQAGVLFIGQSDDCSRQELYALPWIGGRTVHSVADCERAWFVESAGNEDDEQLSMLQRATGNPRWIVVRLHQVIHRESLLTRFVKRHAFYEIKLANEPRVVHDSLRDVMKWEDKREDKEWLAVWDKFEWVFDDRAWGQLTERIERTRPEPVELAGELLNTLFSWRGALDVHEAERFRDEAHLLTVWQEWKEWLVRLQSAIRRSLESREAGEDIAVRILQAIRYVRLRLDEGITQEDAAFAVHLSRGYFSDCFKRATGCTFNEYTKELRLGRAARLLATSECDVQDIAQQCGFQDESYFRKLFREAVAQHRRNIGNCRAPARTRFP